MYLRRLRTLTDYYYPSGKLAGVSLFFQNFLSRNKSCLERHTTISTPLQCFTLIVQRNACIFKAHFGARIPYDEIVMNVTVPLWCLLLTCSLLYITHLDEGDGAESLHLRLRNLILQMVTNMYNLIKEAADIDNQKWNIGSIDLGYK